MANQNTGSKSSKSNRWSFLTRNESNTNVPNKQHNGPSQRGFTSTDIDRNTSQSSFATAFAVSPRSQIMNNSIAPVGLSAPTSFRFSPTSDSHSSSSKQKFLSFVASQNTLSESNGEAVRNASENASLGEKAVFIMNLDQIWTNVEADDELERLGAESNIENERGTNLLDPNTVIENYLSPLLNTSLPFTRPSGCDEKSDFSRSNTENSQRKGTMPMGISDLSTESLSLEEKLRRERQRVHSNGVTQFDWGVKKVMPRSSEPIKYQHDSSKTDYLRIVVPLRGNIYIQDGVGYNAESPLRLLYDKSMLDDNPLTDERKSKSNRRQNRSEVSSSISQDKGAIDPQLSPDGSMVAFVVQGELYVMRCDDCATNDANCNDGSYGHREPIQITFGATHEQVDENNETRDDDDDDMEEVSNITCQSGKKIYGRCISHGLADFIAQEEMDRYQGFWWNNDSSGIIFARVDESRVPPFRITHHGSDDIAGEQNNYEEHRYPFAGGTNPVVSLGYVDINRDVILSSASSLECELVAKRNWLDAKWFHPPDEASEYLARLNWLPDGSACAQWQNRHQNVLLLVRLDVKRGDSAVLHREESKIWINLHHMFTVLPQPVHPKECVTDKTLFEDLHLPEGSFSYIFVSERTGFSHLYLYTYIPGDVSATLVRAVSAGDWIVENLVGVDTRNDLIYFTGTFDSPLEKHLYALPLKSPSGWPDVSTSDENEDMSKVRRGLRQVINSLSGTSVDKHHTRRNAGSYVYPPPLCSAMPPDPLRLTCESGMHSVTMDASCRIFVDSCSDLARPPTVKIYSIPLDGVTNEGKGHLAGNLKLRCVLHDSTKDFVPSSSPSPPELISFPSSDGTTTLHAALYLPNPKIHGNGPYPLICSVYGGPHVQRVNRSWSQCSDMRVQRLCSMGFAVVKCDNRGSSRRGLKFEGAIRHHLGRVEVLDQVTAVRHLVMKRIADPSRVGIYGWSYGGYLAAMCLCRAPDIFKVGIAGAPVTSWDAYDTHYTERYMGLPSENQAGYQESAVLEHVSNMRGKLLIIHGLIDENVHFRHSARLINHLVEAGKDYDLLLFPDERHSPRKLRDRIYMERRMFDFFVKNLAANTPRHTFLGNL